MPQLVTDFTMSECQMSSTQFYALPPKVQQLLQTYGTEIPQGFGKPSIIRLPTYRLAEIVAAWEEAQGK